MKKNVLLKIAFFTSALLFSNINTNAQKKVADSLLRDFENSVYNSIYNPKFWSKSFTPIFTMLKIDIDKRGKVKSIKFSDAADTAFGYSYLHRQEYYNDKLTIEKYAKLQSYKNISLLIPVSYEPNYTSGKHSFTFNKMRSLIKFGKRDFEGRAIILKPVRVKVLHNGNS